MDNRPIRAMRPVRSSNGIANSKFNPNAPSFEFKIPHEKEEIQVDEILTPFPYELNGSHVNGGEENLIVKSNVVYPRQEEDESLWVGSEDLASYGIKIEVIS